MKDRADSSNLTIRLSKQNISTTNPIDSQQNPVFMTSNRERARGSDLLNQSIGSNGSGSNGGTSFTANNDNLLAKLK